MYRITEHELSTKIFLYFKLDQQMSVVNCHAVQMKGINLQDPRWYLYYQRILSILSPNCNIVRVINGY